MRLHLKELIFVFAGGVVGTGMRLVAVTVGGEGLLPLLAVNLLGAFALGWYLARHPLAPGHMSGLLAVGLLGSLTTFSAFAVEAVLLADSGSWLGAVAWVLGSILAGVAAAVAGRIYGSSGVEAGT